MAELLLSGCRSRPLLDYLKALGILRLVATQRDPEARGAWRDDVFVLQSALDGPGLERFFVEEYAPSPILAPWNKGSGFYDSTSAGKALAAIERSEERRLSAIRAAIVRTREILGELGLSDGVPKDAKAKLLARCRARLPDGALEWLDAAVVLTDEDPRYPALLGTGGNDGRLDFTANFLQRIGELIDAKGCPDLLRAALWGDGGAPLTGSAVGQFHPAGVGGPNATAGLEGASVMNPWDFVLGIEGTLVLAGAATRRLGDVSSSQASFPFSVEASAAGYGTGSAAEELGGGARGEIWLPLWRGPASFREVKRLFAEGRAQLGRRRARTGLEFVRAVRELGVDRGIVAFERFAFMKRSGLAYVAATLGRVPVAATAPPPLRLLHEIDPWIERLRWLARPAEAPARFRTALLRVERAVYEFAVAPEARSLGPLVEELGRAERVLAGNGRVPPLQGLSPDWLDAADDGSAEFRIAGALASLFWTEPGWRSLIEPVDLPAKGSRFKWREKEHAGLAWSHRPLHDNLAEVLHRIQLRGQDPFPATGRRAPLGDIGSYLGGLLEEERIERLLFAFLGVRPSHERPGVRTHATGLPAPYSILRMLGIPGVLACGADGRWCVRAPDAGSRPIRAPAVFPLLRAGRISEGLAMALRALRVAGLAPLAGPRRASAFALDRAASDRLAGALLIPVWVIPRLAATVLEPPAPKEGEHAWI